MKAYRLFSSRRNPLDATGAYRSGGRWNSPGTAILYAASSQSLACLEILVHLRNPANLPEVSYVEFDIQEEQVRLWSSLIDSSEERKRAVLESLVLSREHGDDWIAVRQGRRKTDRPAAARPVFQVPSVVVPQEWNYLIDPEANSLTYTQPEPFRLDPRLVDPMLR